MATDQITLRPFREADSQLISSAFIGIGWKKPVEQYDRYFAEQQAGKRHVIVATSDSEFAGYVTVTFDVAYLPFRDAEIPEIQDLNVLPSFQRRGIATKLLDAAEELASKRSRLVGLGVGLSPEYGPAQQLYVLRGYVPDGRGAAQAHRTVRYGEQVVVDDTLVLYLTKRLAA